MKTNPAINDRRQARAWLVSRGIKQVEITRALKLRYPTQVNETLRGARNNRRVLQYLLDKGCPAKYLELPTNFDRVA